MSVPVTRPEIDVSRGPRFLAREALAALIDALRGQGFSVIGPTLRDGAIVYEPIDGPEALPAGWNTEQAPGRYAIQHGDSPRQFAWANGPQALKPLLFAPVESLWRCARDVTGRLAFEPVVPMVRPLAVLGVRACDLAALALHDAHFMPPRAVDPHYAARRAELFIVAIDCSHPADTCFCTSTGDGPDVRAGFDVALAELEEGFVARGGSERGAAALDRLHLPPATADQIKAAADQAQAARLAQKRQLPSRDLQTALTSRLDHPHWNDVASRCLACGNCVAVCPTCFCSREGEHATLDSEHAQHVREWDSCFTAAHGYMHGTQIRPDVRTRYRQWLTHKLAAWHAQYGRSGCVGCGRCITWCPVGIDLTAEVSALLEEPA